ncbi:uncharacterized protein At4g38062 isoform X2 [Impatiens glandulifera]|uniref:uncharacterized protein At4g38062 isoform X2 n=1 Tax=Impatiens glandulifera TaxID=253017 RepID=UPI001FB0E0DA|nr:uncharacterized protein At4g38062 isoform X2 [Impatiens glandulifera]
MDKVCEELYEAKLELSGSLKRALDGQLVKIQEANATIKKQAHEIDDKMGEICSMKQTQEGLEIGMKEKEGLIKHLHLANDKLRLKYDENNKKWEDERREILMNLEDTNMKNDDLERKVEQFKEETKRLKGLLVATEKKPKEAENKAKMSKEFKQRDDVLFKLEEDYQITVDQLKWKKEQFQHLEEAHRKLRSQFDSSKKEWEHERSTLLDEISKLQMSLDSQTRTSQDLQRRLKMCSEALAHEESRRKSLEIQLSETRSRFDDVFVQSEEAKSSVELLTCQRDKDVAKLRDLLGEKEAIRKETEYQCGRLKEENRDLKSSLKELQEAQIQAAGASSSSSLKSKLKNLEQKHRDCSKNLAVKESEWSTKLNFMLRDLDGLRSDLEDKNMVIRNLEAELDSSTRQLEEKNIETSLILMVLKSGISDVLLKFTDDIANLELKNKEKEEKFLKVQSEVEEESKKMDLLTRKLETFKDIERRQVANDGTDLERLGEQLKASTECQQNLKKQVMQLECDLKEVRLALGRANEELEDKVHEVNGLELDAQKWRSIAEELKFNLEEKQHVTEKLKQQIVQMEISLKEEHLELERANTKLEEQFLTGNGLEFEMLTLKSVVEQMRGGLEERQQLEKELLESAGCQDRLNKQVVILESNLKEVHNALETAKAELEEKYMEGDELGFELQTWKCIAERLKVDLEENLHMRRQIEESLLAEIEFEVTIKQENDNLAHELEMKGIRLAELQQPSPASTQSSMACESDIDLDTHEQECIRREFEGAIFAHANAEKILEDYKNLYHRLVDERDERISNLSQLLMLAEDTLKTKQIDITTLGEACEEMRTAHVLKEMDIHVKKMEIISLEEYSVELQDKLQFQEQNLSSLKVERKEIVAELASKQSEIKKLATELRASNSIINQLENEKRMLVGDMKSLVSERDGLFDFIDKLSSRIQELSNEQTKLTGTWQRIVQEAGIDELVDDSKENIMVGGGGGKKVEASFAAEERSPFKSLQLNSK